MKEADRQLSFTTLPFDDPRRPSQLLEEGILRPLAFDSERLRACGTLLVGEVGLGVADTPLPSF